MQQTFQINADKLDEKFIQKVKALFGNADVKIVIEETVEKSTQVSVFNKMERLRKKLSVVRIDPFTDLSALANEVNL